MHISIVKFPLILVAISIVTFIAYLPTLNGDFLHDDLPNLVSNEKVQIESLTIDSLKRASTSSNASTLKRPISMGSFALNYYYFGDNPFSFKLTNVFLHLLTGILVFFITFNLKKISIKNTHDRSSFWFASIVTLIWLVHPLHVSTVAYIVQRMAILSTFFTLLAILFYLIGRLRIINNDNYCWFYFILCVFSITLGIYSKENAALTPIFILLIEAIVFYPISRSEQFKNISKHLFAIIALLVTILIFTFSNDINIYLSNWYYETREFTVSERLYTQARVIISYIKWLVFPNIQELGLFHDDIALSESIISPITTLLSITAIGILLIFSLAVKKTMPLVSLGIIWFFTGHIIESTIIPLEMIYEHRNYLPSIGLIIAFTSLLSTIINNQSNLKRYSGYLVIIVATIFSIITFSRANQWSDSINFAYFEVQHHPNSLRANHTLGMEYKGMVEAGYMEYKAKAYQYLEIASELGDKRIISEAALIALADNLNEPARPEWIDRMATKLSTPVPRISDVKLLKTITDCTKKACILPTAAAQILFDALESNQRLELNEVIHSAYHAARAQFILQRGMNPLLAEHHLKKAIDINLNEIQNYVDYINLLIALNRPKESLPYLKQAKEKNRIYENIPQLTELERIVNLAIEKKTKS